VIAALASNHLGTGSRYPLIVLLAIAMGIQNAAVRQLAVPDLPTTVLTTTLTGVAADAALAGGHGSKVGRRGLSIAAMLLGALIGGLLVLKVDTPAPLALAAGLLVLVSLLTYRASRTSPEWAIRHAVLIVEPSGVDYRFPSRGRTGTRSPLRRSSRPRSRSRLAPQRSWQPRDRRGSKATAHLFVARCRARRLAPGRGGSAHRRV
jgi:hypothetical protein